MNTNDEIRKKYEEMPDIKPKEKRNKSDYSGLFLGFSIVFAVTVFFWLFAFVTPEQEQEKKDIIKMSCIELKEYLQNPEKMFRTIAEYNFLGRCLHD